MSVESITAAEKAEILRNNLMAKLDELKRRAVHVKEVLTPSSYVQRPWLVAGAVAAAAVAYMLLRPREGERGRGRDRDRDRDQPEGLVRVTARVGLAAVVRALVWNVLTHSPRKAAIGSSRDARTAG